MPFNMGNILAGTPWVKSIPNIFGGAAGKDTGIVRNDPLASGGTAAQPIVNPEPAQQQDPFMPGGMPTAKDAAPTADPAPASGSGQPPPEAGTTGGQPIPSPYLYYEGMDNATRAYQQYANWAQTNGRPVLNPSDWMKYSQNLGYTGPGSTATGVPFNSPEEFQNNIWPLLAAAFPGLTQNPNIDQQYNQDYRGNFLNFASGPFGGHPFELLGRAPDSIAAFISNILLNEATNQQGRSEEREGLLRNLMTEGKYSPAADLNRQNLAAAFGLTQPGALDALRASRENQVRSTVAAGENAAMNRLSDLGVLGTGRAAAAPALAASNLANQRLQQGYQGIDEQMEQDLLRRLALSGEIAGSGTDIYRALERDPALMLADVLGRTQNPAQAGFVDFMGQLLNLASGKALATRGGSFFEEAAPLLGSLIGAVGGPIGAALGGAGGAITGQNVHETISDPGNYLGRR